MVSSQQKSIPEWITAHKARDTECRRERDPDSWKSRTTTKSNHTNLTQNICWQKHERLAASAQVRNNRELSRRQPLHEYLVRQIFSGWYGISMSFMAWYWGKLMDWWNSVFWLWSPYSGQVFSFSLLWPQGQVSVWVFVCWLWSQAQVRGRVFFSLTLAFGII